MVIKGTCNATLFTSRPYSIILSAKRFVKYRLLATFCRAKSMYLTNLSTDPQQWKKGRMSQSDQPPLGYLLNFSRTVNAVRNFPLQRFQNCRDVQCSLSQSLSPFRLIFSYNSPDVSIRCDLM